MKNNRFIPYLFLLIATLLIVVSYKDIVHTFYQQDEWLTLGYVKAGAGLSMLEGSTIWKLAAGQYRILSLPLQILIYRYIDFNTYIVGIIALVLHLIASFLLYRVLNVLIKNSLVAFVTGLLFVVFSTSIQSISWFATTFQTIPSFIFLWLSLYLTTLYIKTNRSRYFWWSFICSISAFLFKESGGIALILNPVLYILYSTSKTNIGFFIKKYGIFIVYAAYIGYVRYFNTLTAPQIQGTFFLGSSSSGYQKILMNALLYPYLFFSQIFVPQKVVFDIALWFQNLYYQCCVTTNNAILMGESMTSDILTSFFSMPLILIVMMAYERMKKKFTLQFLIVFYLFSYFPFINIDRGNSYFDSRYMYISSAIGISLLMYSLSILVSSIHKKVIRIGMLFIVGVCICLISLVHIKRDRNIIRLLMFQSQEQILLLKAIKQLVPQLPNKPVFFIETNDKSASEHPLRFQQGIGHTLMVWYADDVQVPKSLLASYFLWNIKDQGYEEVQTNGFGYYRDIRDLQDAITSYGIQKEQIIGLYYESDNKRIINNTENVIRKLY